MRAPSAASVVDLLRRHGRDTTSFQILEPGLDYWLAPGGDACVAYADTGGAWVTVGAPVAPASRQPSAIEQFTAAARDRGRRVRFFAVEQDDFGGAALARMHIGEQPSWDPAAWPAVLRRKRSLREQLRRARVKGVTVRRAHASELASPAAPTRRGMDALIARWRHARPMAPMGFVVQVELYTSLEERRVFVAERAGEVIGVLSAVPIYARGGWFFEDVLRHPAAPNGTVELLFDHAMQCVAGEGSRHVSYGLAPLARTPSPLLRRVRDHTRWLYHFEGLRAFKAKLVPDAWQPVYLAYPRGERGVRAVVDVLAAFAHGSFARFGLATLRHWATVLGRRIRRIPGPLARPLIAPSAPSAPLGPLGPLAPMEPADPMGPGAARPGPSTAPAARAASRPGETRQAGSAGSSSDRAAGSTWQGRAAWPDSSRARHPGTSDPESTSADRS